MRRIALFGILLVGCTKQEEETGSLDPDTDPDVLDGCSPDNAPTIASFTVEPDGMSEGDVCGDASMPLILLGVEANDEDGDLHLWRMQVWWDEVVDGAVSTAAGPSEVQGAVGTECKAFVANLGMQLCVTGNPPYQTEIEFGMRLLDNADNQSPLMIKSFTTPDEAGNY